MKNGRFNTSKYRGKVQKIGEETLKGLFSRFLIPTAHLFGLMQSTLATLNTSYTVGSSILWVYTFVYHIFIHFNNFSSTFTNFIHFSFIIHPIYLH
jgi:hypothetical protein